MKEYDPKTCIDPWIGLLFLVIISLAVSGSLWFMSKKPQPQMTKQPTNAPMRAAFQPSGPMAQQTMGDKIIF